MAWTPDEIAALLSSSRGDTSERAAQLKEVLAAIQGESNDSLAALVEKLADGARDPSWRLPLGESGLLEHVLSVVPVTEEPQHALNKQALRLVGNACADCDENRARVVESGALPRVVMVIMKNPEADALLPFAIAAALNVCVDCQSAQLQASEAGLSKVLVDIVSGNRLSSCQSSLSHIMTIVELLCNQDTEPKARNPNTPALLLGLATGDNYDADLDTFIEICTPALAYLTFQDLQPVLLENGGIELLQRAFHQLYTRFDTSDADPETAGQLKQVGDAFLTVFADISALPGFPTSCPLDSKVVQTLIEWLGSSPPLYHLQTAACLSLGNLSRSDESSTALLKQSQDPLLSILSRAATPTTAQPAAPGPSATPLQLTHAALSFLKNLAIPEINKPHLGAALLDPANPLLPRLWTSTRTQPQLQFAAVSLTRLLLVNCPANVRLLCTPLPVPAGTDQTPTAAASSNLALLTATAASADEDPIKVEAARAAALVCRALHSPSSPTHPTEFLDPSWVWTSPSPTPPSEEEPPALTAFYTTHAPRSLTPSLARLLTQPRFPTLRSDAIFVLALMSRSPAPAGAGVALQVLLHQSSSSSSTESKRAGAGAGWQVLAKAITGSEDNELAGAFTQQQQQVVEIEDEDEDETAEEKEDKKEKEQEQEEGEGGGGVTVEKLSLEPQALDNDAQGKGQKQQQPPARAAQMDRENGMVLVAELLRQFPDELASLRRPLEAVLNKGGELVVQDREREQGQM